MFRQLKNLIFTLLTLCFITSCYNNDFFTDKDSHKAEFLISESNTRISSDSSLLTSEINRISWKLFERNSTGGWNGLVQENQMKGDDPFGSYETMLNEGVVYRLVCIGYNGVGNCSIGGEKVTFKSNQVGLTYSYVSQEFLADTVTKMSVNPIKCVSKIKIFPEDYEKAKDFEVEQVYFEYKGCSAYLDPYNKRGYSTTSTQKVTKGISELVEHDGDTIPSFELYTFPQGPKDTITKLEVQTQDINGVMIGSDIKTDGIPIYLNSITNVYGKFFSKSGIITEGIKVDTSWDKDTTNVSF